ncbi:uncharacterized protein LAESUDRAFT_755722 [Laetiporus sulphureus 93-53]|uniref:F-box domain-containing protein n=1 Tax=Laetiporus sulphureus 93-53 TaxID=1314785 RepID=A0A165GDU4_9APHY|nr:uncharacterized protein LAESUDRAFT_755722 [Laetiporus sulphureus 93-53]KZT10208.1 hypothetical protein LAESUDRAFT_755722 [Laetiporus sulphureus 93-53]
MPSLPFEIQEFVLDNLSEDSAALIACSLTCRAWVSITRAHLFKSVELKGDDDCVRLSRALNASSGTSTEVADCVKRLVINPGPPVRNASSRTGWTIDWFPVLLPRLRKLEEFRLTKTVWDEIRESGCVQCITASFPSLRVLAVEIMVFSSLADLTSIITSYPLLSTLELSHIAWFNRETLPNDVVTRIAEAKEPIVLHELSVHCVVEFSKLLALLHLHFQLQLRKLYWDISLSSVPAEPAALVPLIHGAEAFLEDLSLNIWGDDVLADVDLSRHIHLRSISILVQKAPHWRNATYTMLPILLEHITSPSMQKINLSFSFFRSVDFEADIGFLDWKLLDRVLASLGRNRPSMVIVFCFRYHVGNDGWMPDVVSLLKPRLAEVLSLRHSVRAVCGGYNPRHKSKSYPDRHYTIL